MTSAVLLIALLVAAAAAPAASAPPPGPTAAPRPHAAAGEECGCANVRQTDYRGNMSTTESGVECVKWDQAGYTTPENFPHAGLEDNNFCRNPRGYEDRAWCYTEEGRSEDCAVPSCEDCADPVTDVPCGVDRACGPGEGEGPPFFFCDYELGLDAGGYCVDCVEWGAWSERRYSLTFAGQDDFRDKCSCPASCGEGHFCSGDPGNGCVGCLDYIVHPAACEEMLGYISSDAKALEECEETCPPTTCRQSADCDDGHAYDGVFFCLSTSAIM